MSFEGLNEAFTPLPSLRKISLQVRLRKGLGMLSGNPKEKKKSAMDMPVLTDRKKARTPGEGLDKGCQQPGSDRASSRDYLRMHGLSSASLHPLEALIQRTETDRYM